MMQNGHISGLDIFWNQEIKLEVIGYSEYHIDVRVDEMIENRIRITFAYGASQMQERYKTWNMLCGTADTSN